MTAAAGALHPKSLILQAYCMGCLVCCCQVLVRMHTKIVPHMASPLLLTDFLFKALDVGGLMGMLALHGIFILVTKHGLEYPHFYERLYRLLTPASLMVSPVP